VFRLEPGSHHSRTLISTQSAADRFDTGVFRGIRTELLKCGRGRFEGIDATTGKSPGYSKSRLPGVSSYIEDSFQFPTIRKVSYVTMPIDSKRRAAGASQIQPKSKQGVGEKGPDFVMHMSPLQVFTFLSERRCKPSTEWDYNEDATPCSIGHLELLVLVISNPSP
jgi:hypothetical protein